MDLIIFARYWQPGQVKTRLCPPLTPEQAATVSRQCLDLLVQRVSTIPHLIPIIAFEPISARAPFAERYPKVRLLPQHGDDLTAKLDHLLADRKAPCLITGSDCPTVPLAYYTEAHAALESGADVVLGPTRDGGSYLLGVRPGRVAWFHDIPWSTAGVSAALRRQAREQGWRLHELPPWYDIDTMADLAALCEEWPQEDIRCLTKRLC